MKYYGPLANGLVTGTIINLRMAMSITNKGLPGMRAS